MPGYFITYLDSKHALYLRLKARREVAQAVRAIKGLVMSKDQVVYLIAMLELVAYLPI